MAENSKIEWTTHTFNPWRGCTKVSEGCRNCYAETLSGRNPKTLGVWGPSGTRVVASESMWREPAKWNAAAAKAGTRARVFCASLADVFEDWQGPMVGSNGKAIRKRSDGSWITDGSGGILRDDFPLMMNDVRRRLFDLIYVTPNLDWLLLTKRPENAARMMGPDGVGLYAHANGPVPCPQPNVWLGTSVEDQATADARIPHLLNVPAAVRFLSCEPLLGPLEFSDVSKRSDAILQLGKKALSGIDWVIVGGESGPKARPMHPEWALSIRNQCQAAGVPFFFKQWGEYKPYRSMTEGEAELLYDPVPEGQPADSIRKCHVPTVMFPPHPLPVGGPCDLVFKVGKKNAGRLLDGRTWDEFPTTEVPA